MVAILTHVGTTDWDRERLNTYVNTPASWSVHALRTDAVWASSLARVNTFKCFTHVSLGEGEGEAQSLLVGLNGGTVLSSKQAKKVFSSSVSLMSVSVTWLDFFL